MKKLKATIIIDSSIINSHHGIRRYLLSLAESIRPSFHVTFFNVEETGINGELNYSLLVFDKFFSYNNGFDRNAQIQLGSENKILWDVLEENKIKSDTMHKSTSVYVGKEIEDSDICIIGAPWICAKINIVNGKKVYCMGYDAIPISYSFKEFNDRGLTNFGYLHHVGYQKAVRQFDGILAISNKSKFEISKFVGKDKITTIPPFLPIGFDSIGVDDAPREKTVILAAPFDIRKGLNNLPELLNDHDIKKILIFGGVRCHHEELLKFFKSINIEKCEWWHTVDTKKQIALYKSSSLLIFPSLNEGLGLPVLEALACGTNVVVSNIEPLNTLVGEDSILTGIPNIDKKIISSKLNCLSAVKNQRDAIEKFGGECLSNFLIKLT
uniref:Glycosyltransferase n=1 Tax=Aeromonas hydrophila TaxID=644 RepID=A0A346ACA2_AERHY|nr:glycosyltransferase [Aeromonas hydrophila]